jgi:hypothetical protein
MSEPRPEAVTAATRPILRRLPSLGPDRCRDLALDVLRAAQPHLEAGEPQAGLTEKLRAAFAEYGLTPGQQAGIESACARLIEATARRPYPGRKGKAS